MCRCALILFGAWVGCLTGCNSATTRIREQPELFASLDPVARAKVARGEVDLGFTPEMVRLALGDPTERTDNNGGKFTWLYRNFHRDPKDIIQNGYRRRIVFDPVLRAETVIVEPIDDRLAARLAPRSLRLTFRDGRVATIERTPEL